MPFTIRRLASHEWALYRSARLASLADAPQAFGSTYAAEMQRAPALWQARLMAVTEALDCPLIAEIDGAAVGLVWGKTDALDPALVHVYQMWVAPQARGKGVAAGLLDGVTDWARANGAASVRLAVTPGNEAAAALYRKRGFVDVGAPEAVHEGSSMLSQTMVLVLSGQALQ